MDVDPWQFSNDLSVGTYNAANEVTPTEGCSADFFIWSPRYIDSAILRDSYNSSGTLVADDRVYYLADANCNVTGLVKYDSNAQQWNVAERYTYDPYGEVTYCDSAWTAYSNQESVYSNTVLYAGRTLDTVTSLYYNRARYYDASLERFISRDPIGYAGGINLYEYCSDDPLTRTDPSGMQCPAPAPAPPPKVPPLKIYCPPPESPGVLGGVGRLCVRVIGGVFVFVDCVFGSGANTCGDAEIHIKPVPVNPPPPAPPKPKQTCSNAEKAILQAAVVAACKGPLSGRRCRRGMSAAEALANAAKFNACAAARDAINQTCFSGGDIGHQVAANSARNAAQRCREIAAFQPPSNVG